MLFSRNLGIIYPVGDKYEGDDSVSSLRVILSEMFVHYLSPALRKHPAIQELEQSLQMKINLQDRDWTQSDAPSMMALE